MKRLYYKLTSDKRVIPFDDISEWGKWFGQTYKDGTHWIANSKLRGMTISTIFLGIDHGFSLGPPILFETMIFGGYYNDYQERCCTYDQAMAQHVRVVQLVKNLTWYQLARGYLRYKLSNY